MKAWYVTNLGEPAQALELRETETPRAGPGQVVIDVHAAGLNFPDLMLCRGTYHHKPELPFILGCEASGIVLEAGQGVDLRPGDRVLTAPLSYGCFAEQVLVPAATVFPVPVGVSFPDASVVFMGFQTAWVALHHRGRLAPGMTVLIHGAAGGVGSSAVQLAVAAGAQVIATVSSAAKAAVCKALGAQTVWIHGDGELPALVRERTAGRGCELVLDPVGGELFDQSLRCLAVDGRLLSVGFASGTVPTVKAGQLLIRNAGVEGVRLQPYRENYSFARRVHDELMVLLGAGKIKATIDRILPGAELAAGLQMIHDRSVQGRVVIEPPQ